MDLTNSTSGDLLADLLQSDDSLLFVSAKAPVKNESMLIDLGLFVGEFRLEIEQDFHRSLAIVVGVGRRGVE